MLEYIALVLGQNFLDGINFPWLTNFLSKYHGIANSDLIPLLAFMLTEKMGIGREIKPTTNGKHTWKESSKELNSALALSEYFSP